MRQVRELLVQMRNYYNKLRQDDQGLLDAAATLNPRDGIQTAGRDTSHGTADEHPGVGTILDRGEFGLGIAPRDSRPINRIELTKEQEAELKEAQKIESDDISVPEEDFDNQERFLVNSKKNKNKKRKDISKQDAFLEFKAGEDGQQLELSILDNRQELKDIKIRARDLTEKCNVTKKSID